MANRNLLEAVKNNDLDRTRTLIESYVATNVNILEKDEHGWTALHWASCRGHLEIVKLLVESGMSNADVFEKDYRCGCTALHIASCWGHFEIVKYLVNIYIDAGVDFNVLTNFGQTLIELVSTGNTRGKKIKQFLIDQLEIQQNSYLLK